METAGHFSTLEATSGRRARPTLSSTSWLSRSFINSSESTGAPSELGTSGSRDSDSDVENFSSSFDAELDLGLNNLTQED